MNNNYKMEYMTNEEDIFFVPSPTPSSKNGRQWTGQRFLPSRATIKWRKDTESWWIANKEKFNEKLIGLDKPYKVGFHFTRATKHKFDIPNPLQTIFDEMTKYGFIDDDNSCEIIPYPLCVNGEWHTYDKSNPGCYIKIFTDPEEIKRLHEILNIKPNE